MSLAFLSVNAMSARIKVMSGPQVGTQLPIEEVVCRIGSRNDCELCLTGVEPDSHIATLRFNDGRYTVTNRSQRGVSVGGRKLAWDETSFWKHGETLQVNPSISLRLDIDGDPTPAKEYSPQLSFEEMDEEYHQKSGQVAASKEPSEAERKPETKKSRVVEWTALGLCLVLLVMILMMGSSESTVRDEETVRSDFGKLTKELAEVSKTPSNAAWNTYLLGLFESARASELRNDYERAQADYRELRDQIANRSARTDLETRVWRFCLLELEALDHRF
jgi:hypothetical protein